MAKEFTSVNVVKLKRLNIVAGLLHLFQGV